AVGDRDAEGDAVHAAGELGDHLLGRLGRPGRRGDDREGGGAAAAALPYRRGPERLAGGGGVDRGGHQVLNTEGLLEHLGDRRQAVGGAGGHGDDGVPRRVVALVIDA